MAEILGVFASCVAVAQLAGSIVASSQKIYTFLANVKDAPKNVTDLITEIELLGGLLLEYYDAESAGGRTTSAITEKTLKYCRHTMNELDEILRKMEDVQQTNLPGLSGIPLIHKPRNATRTLIDGKMKAYGLGLYRSLTYACEDCDIVRSSSSEESTTVDPELIDVDIYLQFLPKAWLKMKAYSMKQSRRFGKWKYSWQFLCIIPNDSPIFTACSNGDKNEVIRLIETKKGSVFDVSEDGWTLLHVAAANMRHELCRWLLLNGARSSDEGIRVGWTALHAAAEFGGRLTPNVENYGKSFEPPNVSIRYHRMITRPAAEVLDTIRVPVELGKCDPMEEIPVERCLDLCRWPSDANGLAQVIMRWFHLLRKANHDLQDYLARESDLHPPEEVFERENSGDMMFFFEMYDYRSDFELMRRERVEACLPENIAGAWKSEHEEDLDTGLKICPCCIIQPTNRSPDFRIAFWIGQLKDGVQSFEPAVYTRRRLKKSKCCCYYTCCEYEGELDDTPVETHFCENLVDLRLV
ncbi:hypothetical protein SBOR_6045 [Sclerotinia borealis F-4128]|uniref:Uncharacterized protein n=1 Tax=Sclerotinia borealis (strain F-4128) TaxID=1432307 RepID=W9C9X3_SCLBF|nr:hypothetical protein SBOR_6045 [Sclerotinia borealis F-4128]